MLQRLRRLLLQRDAAEPAVERAVAQPLKDVARKVKAPQVVERLLKGAARRPKDAAELQQLEDAELRRQSRRRNSRTAST